VKEFWDTRYDTEEFVYGRAPNRFLSGELQKLNPGRILLPGEGEGRNAIYAALLGWDVDAIDQSSTGAQKARQLALDNKLNINYQVHPIETYTFKTSYYDAVALIFVHLPPPLRTRVHLKLMEAIKPGGRLIIEAFHSAQLGKTTGGPQSEAMLYNADLLRKDFKALELIYLKEEETELDEGIYHQGNAHVVRLIGIKPTK
jgi:SAM-dependent methyltransferase